ncbi:MAG: class I SAM-dependent methyltransferase [Acidimicrobiia bacterium]
MTGAPGPGAYTHGHHDSVLRSHRWRTAANSAPHLLARLRPGLTLLDVGCGPGTLTCDLAERVAPGRVTGIDLSPEVVDEARATAAARGTINATFATGDLHRLDGNSDVDGPFDVVHAHQVLQHLADPVGALRALAGLARPGGGVVAVRDADYPAMAWHPASAALDGWLDAYLAVTRRNGAEAAAGRRLPAWARAAGLADTTYTTSTWTFTGDDAAWWADVWAERTMRSAFAEQAVAYGIASEPTLAELAAGWQAWAADPDAVFVVVHGELVARL